MALFINGSDTSGVPMMLLPQIEKGEKAEITVKIVTGGAMLPGTTQLWLTATLDGNPVIMEPDMIDFAASPTEVVVKSRDELSDEGDLVISFTDSNPLVSGMTASFLRLRAEVKETASPAPAPVDPAGTEEAEETPNQPLSPFVKKALLWAAILLTLLLIPTAWYGFKGVRGAGIMIGTAFDQTMEHAFKEDGEVYVDNAGKIGVIEPEPDDTGNPAP
jgi:hypothetical protein